MAALVHGTALAVGATGLILVGPSGAGKSSMAVRLIAEAKRSGHFAALLSDDQVLVEVVNGRLVATPPPAIRGLIELRGSGIGRMETIGAAVVDFALQPVIVDSSTRIPQENQRWTAVESLSLPLVFIDRAVADPFGLLAALIAGFPTRPTFPV